MFRSFAPSLCAFLTRYLGSRMVAEDLVQDLFLTLWKSRAELRIERAVGTYLFSAAKKRALNYLRAERVRERFRTARLERAEITSTAGEGEILELLDVQKAVEALPPRCRRIFTLSRQEGLTYSEIAAGLGLSIKTVEAQMGRALKALAARRSPSGTHRVRAGQRTGRAIDIMRAHGQEMQERKPGLTAATCNIEPFKLLHPIPYREVRLDDLEQNPGG